MFQVAADPERNRLYVTLGGYLEAGERQAAAKAVLQEAARLAPGFDVITDISTLHPTNKDGFKDLLRAKSALKLKGVGRIIRVTGIPLSRIQMERVSEAAGYHEGQAATREEAERLLAGGNPDA